MKKHLLLLMLPLAAPAISAASTEPSSPDTIKIISFNVRQSFDRNFDGVNCWDNRREAALEMVRQEQPALMGLQEACPDQLKWFDDNLPTYRHIGVGRDDGINGECMAIYYDTTRVALGENSTFWLSETPETPSRGWDAACIRTVTWGIFTILDSGREILYLNTHLDHIGPEARKNSALLIADRVTTLAGPDVPAFLTADFNTTAADPIFDPIKTTMGEARATAPLTDNTPTFTGYGAETPSPENIIDHIFYRHSQPIYFRTLTSWYGAPYISDHYPVAALFIIP